jgi:hypothetical protein
MAISKRIYQMALDSQSAVNSGALIHGLGYAVDTLQKEAHSTGQGTEFVNTHPIIILFLEQLAHLSGAMLNHPKYTEAYKACEDGAK